jgi:methionyl-tRNA formyltransferase
VLPRYRGAAPIQRAVLAGDAETGVTIMRVEAELDAGPMFSIATVPIPPDATSGDMDAVLASLGARLLVPVVDDLAAGRAVETPQDHSQATHAAKITKEEGVIDWTQPAAVVHNRVRGLQPWPLAFTRLGSDRLVLRRTRSLGARSMDRHIGVRERRFPDRVGDGPVADLAPAPAPGVVVRAAGDELVVACGGGTELQILEIQPEGRRTMTAREFLAGRAIEPGARFTS